MEDGREIFDDDLDDESVQKEAKKHRSSTGRKRKGGKDKDENEEETGRKGNIRHMLQNMQTKKKKVEEVKLEDDAIFGNLLQELDTKPISKPPVKTLTPAVNHKLENGSVRPHVHTPRPKPTVSFIKPEPKVIANGKPESKVAVPSKPTPPLFDEIVIKEEPEEVVESASQIIEDCDSMDFDFSAQDLEMVCIFNVQYIEQFYYQYLFLLFRWIYKLMSPNLFKVLKLLKLFQ